MVFWRSARHRAGQLAALTPAERGWLLRAAILLPLVALGRRALRFRRLQSLVARALPLRKCPHSPPDPRVAEPIARAVSIAARHGLVRANCLERSLVLWGLLRRAGLAATLQLGARRVDGRFEAHAWVDLDGTVLNDADDVAGRFAPVLGITEQRPG